MLTTPRDHAQAAGSPSFTTDEIAAQLIGSIDAAPLERQPFCHIHVRGCLPEPVYDSMLKHLPPLGVCTPFNIKRYRRADGRSTRDEFHMTDDNLARLSADAAALWRQITSVLSSPGVREAVFAKLAPDLAERFGISAAEVRKLPGHPVVYLTRDSEDYAIKPHPDGLNKIVTMLFYLPPDDRQPELGTSIYRKKGFPGFLPGAFEEVKRAPFVRNSCLAFAVSDSPRRRSWHGREPLRGFAGTRDTLVALFLRSMAPKPKRWTDRLLPFRRTGMGG